MPTYGKVKVNTLTYDSSGSAVDLAVSGIAPKADPTFTGDVTFTGAAHNVVFDASDNALEFADDAKATFGGDGDLQLFHDGNHSYVQDAGTGDLYLRGTNSVIISGTNTGQTLGQFIEGDGCVFRFNNTIRIATTNTGIDVTGTAVTDGLTVAGDSSFTGQSDFTGHLKEAVVISAGKLSDAPNLDIEAGNVFMFTVAESTTSTPNLRYNNSTTLDSKMAVGDCLSVTILTTANASAYSAQLTIDGAAVTENWTGGSAPSSGGSSGWDIHAYTIIKKGSSGTFTSDYAVIANHTKTS